MRTDHEIFIVTLAPHVYSTIKIPQHKIASNISYGKDKNN